MVSWPPRKNIMAEEQVKQSFLVHGSQGAEQENSLCLRLKARELPAEWQVLTHNERLSKQEPEVHTWCQEQKMQNGAFQRQSESFFLSFIPSRSQAYWVASSTASVGRATHLTTHMSVISGSTTQTRQRVCFTNLPSSWHIRSILTQKWAIAIYLSLQNKHLEISKLFQHTFLHKILLYIYSLISGFTGLMCMPKCFRFPKNVHHPWNLFSSREKN